MTKQSPTGSFLLLTGNEATQDPFRLCPAQRNPRRSEKVSIQCLYLPEKMSKQEYVFTNDNIRVNGKLTYFPIYMVMFLQDEPIGFIDISVDKFKL